MTYLTSKQAAAELGVSVQTLYAYVSRGRLPSVASPDGQGRRYLAEDILALRQRKLHGGDPARVAREALHWGLPVLQSRVSVVSDGRLYYRGQDSVALATQCSFEEVVALLWLGERTAALPEGGLDELPEEWRTVEQLARRLPPLESFQMVLPLVAVGDSSAYDLRPQAVPRVGVRILALLAATAAHRRPPARLGVASLLQRAWGAAADIVPLLQAALILYADNGLSPSTFTARCVASAGSTPYAVVMAGLAALQGSKHGGASEQAESLLREAGSPGGAQRAVAVRLRRGEGMPGFGHPSYPQGDPRGALLLDLACKARPRSPVVAVACKVMEAVHEVTGQRPNVDFGVVTLCRALDLPAAAPLTLLGLARTAGWIAHAIEQYGEGRVIRPTARYDGEPPRD